MPPSREAEYAYIGAGSNIAPFKNMRRGLEMLSSQARFLSVSTFYRTQALNRPDQADFVNGVVKIETRNEASELKFRVLRGIEAAVGRVRRADAWAPRRLDLDLLLYGSAVVDAEGLRLPDPDIRDRPFVAVPLLELDADLVLPDTGERLADIVSERMALDCMEPLEAFTRELREKLIT